MPPLLVSRPVPKQPRNVLLDLSTELSRHYCCACVILGSRGHKVAWIIWISCQQLSHSLTLAYWLYGQNAIDGCILINAPLCKVFNTKTIRLLSCFRSQVTVAIWLAVIAAPCMVCGTVTLVELLPLNQAITYKLQFSFQSCPLEMKTYAR